MANVVRLCGVPRRRFGYFAAEGKVTRPLGRNPVKLPAARRVVAPYRHSPPRRRNPPLQINNYTNIRFKYFPV